MIDSIVMTSDRPSLQDFVDDELLRAPLAFDQVIDAVLQQWRHSLPAGARRELDPVRALSQHRAELVQRALRCLRERVADELARAPAAAAMAKAERTALPPLALIDEDAVGVDVAASRAIERVKAAAEFELRELQAYTSALVDDVNVARDTNPFRPESHVRALAQALAGLPLSQGLQAALIRDAAEPLARALRQAYAASASRLEAQGVAPAAHRTIVQTITTRSGQDLPGPDPLVALRDTLPAALDDSAALEALAGHEPALRIDPQVAELMGRLFDAIAIDRDVPAVAHSLIQRLRPAALSAAAGDAKVLEGYQHAVWRFVDLLAHELATTPPAEASRCLAYCQHLVDRLTDPPGADSARFEWALGRLVAFDRHALQQAVAAARHSIEALQASIAAALPREDMAIDVGTLDTVPAALLEQLPPAPSPPAPPLALQVGDRLRAHLQGQWRLLRLLWCDVAADHWLLRDLATERSWVLRMRALDRLVVEQLALPCRAKSLVRVAARRVMRGTQATPA